MTRLGLLVLLTNAKSPSLPGIPKYGVPPSPIIKFKDNTVPPVEMDSITDIVSQLEQPGADAVLLNTDVALNELIEQLGAKGRLRGAIRRRLVPYKMLVALSRTFPNEKFVVKEFDFQRHSTHPKPGDRGPVGVLHLDSLIAEQTFV
jgi:hypothetical protein